MSIFKRGNTYWYHFYFNGKHVQRSSKSRNLRTAEKIERAYRTQLEKGEVGLDPPKKVPTLKQAIDAFLEWSGTEHAAHPNTSKRYKTASKPLFRYFGNVRLDAIDSEKVEAYKAWRSKQRRQPPMNAKANKKKTRPLRPATINRELAFLKILFNRNDDSVPANPVRKVKLLNEDNLQTRVLSADEEKLYLLAASQPLQDIATLMLETGMRPEEVCHIRRENVNLDDIELSGLTPESEHSTPGYVLVPSGKTKAARRKLALSERAYSVLQNRLDNIKIKGEWLFPGRGDGDKPLVKINNAHTSTVKRSKVAPFKLYALRHTFATRAVQAGVDLVTLAALLGHLSLTMVMRYAHPSQEHQFEAMQKVAAYRTRKVGQR
jgi:integrase